MHDQLKLINNPEYRPNVGIMLINKEHQVLAGEAAHYVGEWMMPQGGIIAGETTLQAMQRELIEETGICVNDTRLITEHTKWLSYQFRKPLIKDGGHYIGQRQKWFLLEYNGGLPDAQKTQEREFSQFNWVEPNWLLEHTTPFKVTLYKEIFTKFKQFFP